MQIIRDNTFEELISCELINDNYTVKVLMSINGGMFYATVIEETDTISEVIYKSKWFYSEIDAKNDDIKFIENK